MPDANAMTAPSKVDTLREEEKCPFEFGTDDCELEDGFCRACGYEAPILEDPDLTKAQEFDKQQRTHDEQFVEQRKQQDESKLNRPGRPSFSAVQKEGYWIPGYSAVIYHPSLGFHVSDQSEESHIELTGKALPKALQGDEQTKYEVYDETYRALYNPRSQDLLHMSGPGTSNLIATGDIIAPPASDVEAEGWKYFWADLARKNKLPFKRIGIVAYNENMPVPKFKQTDKVEPTTYEPDALTPHERGYERPDTYYGNDPTDPNYQVFEFLRNRRSHIEEVRMRFAARLSSLQNNKGEKGMRQSKIRLTAHASLPSEDKLEQMGWNLAKKATPDPNDKSERSLAEDGRRASDEPTDTRVVADQKAPITTKRKKRAERVIRREEIIESDDREPGYGEATGVQQQPTGDGLTTAAATKRAESLPSSEGGGVVPEQYKSLRKEDAEPQHAEDSTPIKEHQPGTQKEQYSDIKSEEETPQFSEDSAPIKEHHPDGVVPEQYKGIKREDLTTVNDDSKDLGGEKFNTSVSSSVRVLTAMKLAELEQELGLDSTWEGADKFARIAELEGRSVDALNERIATLNNVKEAGLSKPKQRKSASTLPSFRQALASSNAVKESAAEVDLGDEIVFMS